MTADHTAIFFEEWANTLGRTVRWLGANGWLEVAAPCNAIETSYQDDPETTKLRGLLHGQHALYRADWKIIAAVTADVIEGQHPRRGECARLYDLLNEIAGEHGRSIAAAAPMD